MVYLKKIKDYKYLIALAIVFLLLFVFMRGTHISNFLKKIILPEIEMATGRKVIAQKIYLNLFPLFIEAKGLKVFDDGGERILVVPRVKAYIELSQIITRTLNIRRLVIKEPDITIEKQHAEEILSNVREYLSKVREPFLKVKVSAVEIEKGNGEVRDDVNLARTAMKGLHGEVVLGESPRVRAEARSILFHKKGWPEVAADGEVDLVFGKDAITVKKIAVGASGSQAKGEGEYARDGGKLRTTIGLLVATVKKIFSLDGSGNGRLNGSGIVHYSGGTFSVDMKLEGNFYLQTLMELLEVKERIEGWIDLSGEIKGPVHDLTGRGKISLTKGNLFDVAVDSLACSVTYEKGSMHFTDGSGRLYNGQAKVSATIELPVVNTYTLAIDFSDVDSKPVFGLIGWDPGVQPGKIQGNLSTSGESFDPRGWFEYRSAEKGKDVLGRVKEIRGKYALDGWLLTMKDLRISTGLTDLDAGGTVDIDKEVLAFSGMLVSRDIEDISAPHSQSIRGQGEFQGKISGTFDDPVISGNMRLVKPLLYGYQAETLTAELTYRKEVLNIPGMEIHGNGEACAVKGGIAFKKAKELFDLSEPVFGLRASVVNGDLEKFVRIFSPDFKGKGRLSADLEIRGMPDVLEVSGNAHVDDGAVYRVAFDRATFGLRYREGKLAFSKMLVTRGKSELLVDGEIAEKGGFSFRASSEKISLSDLVRKEIRGDAAFSLHAEGSGTFEDPVLKVQARMIEGKLKGKSVGTGDIHVTVRNRDILLKGSLFNDRITVAGKGRLEKQIPWEAKIDIQTGRYDPFVSFFLKETPEDLLVNLSGTVALRGDVDHISASAALKQVTLSLYGHSFSNENEVQIGLDDRRLSLEKFVMRSGEMSLQVEGDLVIGREYNLSIEGNSDLSPFKGLSNKIAVLKGDGEFVLSITGSWESPQINGGVTLKQGSFGLKEYPYRLGSIQGYLYLDNDRIVLQKLGGKTGGGEVELTGVIYLQKFSVKRFYVEAGLNNITTNVSTDFTVNYSGNILLKGTPDSQVISGDLRINHARYRERVEWKSWLLTAKKAEKIKTEISVIDKAVLNVKITGKDNIFVDNNVVRTAVGVDMVLRGTLYRPVLFGRLEAREGTVYFRNNDFRILHASADFTDPARMNPIVIISAETLIKGYKIRMNLEGQVDHFSMSLSSDPVLKEMDILALLTVGQKGGELKGLEGGIGAGEATSFVTGKIQDVVEERMRSIIGFDRFQIDPYVSKTTGIVEPRLTISKRLLGEKVFVTYASSVGSTAEQIIKIEYLLSKNVSLIGVRDERGILGGDIRFSFEFK